MSYISVRANLNDQERVEVAAALREWKKAENTLHLTELLDPALLSRLKQQFSVVESGVVTLRVKAELLDGSVQRSFRITRDARPEAWTRVGDRRFMVNWERHWQ